MSANQPLPGTRTCTVLWLDYQLKSANQMQYRHWSVKSRENKRCRQAVARALQSLASESGKLIPTTWSRLLSTSEIAWLAWHGALEDKNMDWQYQQIQTAGRQGTIVLIEL